MKTPDTEHYIEAYLGRFSTKQLIAIPLVVLILSLAVLTWTYYSTGSPVGLGVEFTGGTIVTVQSPYPYDVVQQEFVSRFPDTPPLNARDAGGGRVLLQFGPMDKSQQLALTDYISSHYGQDVSLKQMSAIYSTNLQKSAIQAVFFAFFGMAGVVFFIFRSAVPSGAVVISAFSDIVVAATLMDLFGISLTFGTMAALLMLIGYSVDSDILLTTRLLKRRGTTDEKVRGAMKTGLTMTFTTMAAILVMFIVSTFAHLVTSFSRIDILTDISVVLLLGLVTDLMNTWMLNTGLLKWYLTRGAPARKKKRGRKK